MRRRGLRVLLWIAAGGLAAGLGAGWAGAAIAACADPVGRLASIEGLVEVQRPAATGEWRPAVLDQPLCGGDAVRVGRNSRAAAALANDNKVRLDENTTLRLIVPPAPGVRRTLIEMLGGGAYFFSRRPQSLDVLTPVVNAAVEGTEFLVRIGAEETLVGVVRGRVVARNALGEAVLGDGEAATAAAATAPRSFLLVKPFDAVAWALYYPSVLPWAAPGLTGDLTAAAADMQRGRPDAAIARLDAAVASADARDVRLYRAAALLAVGRVDAAEADIAEALAVDPRSALAHALKAVIGIARNDRAAGLAAAEQAVALDPASAPAAIALSYALQADFRIEDARRAAERATEAAPDNPLAWARLAELWLMQGWRERSQAAADRAIALAPDLARARTVSGFAALAAFDTGRARLAFETAVFIQPDDPQARLGLGLTKIRDGQLSDGRSDLELAALLDPNNALLRSYLGKAFFEEKREPQAAGQFGLAQTLDPNDPTGFFYDAILLQTQNRPVEALKQLERSIALNDDRAVYRSRELLDSDRAARGASLGRIYDDLGFTQLGVNAATRSLTFDPASASAHRFLSDIYVTQPRTQIARVSELLQAQLLQDVNINPVQPSLAVTDFNIITTGGPARPGFNEFNPLFEGNQARLNLTGLAGNNATYGNEAVVSGLYDRYSISAGQFHYQTDGFRDNNGVDSDIYNLFAQAAISPDFNVQAEVRREKTNAEFIPLLFNPDNFRDTAEIKSRQTSARLGARYNLSPNSTLLGSFIFSDGRFDQDEILPALDAQGNPVFADGRPVKFKEYLDDRIHGTQVEASHLWTGGGSSIISGSSAFFVSTDRNAAGPSQGLPFPVSEDFNTQQQSGYVYANLKLRRELLTTLGLSVDHYKQGTHTLYKPNPKLGVQWEVVPNVLFRAAAFRVVKPPFVTSRTIQPTQVAGFNQFFDDPDGTESWRFGGAVDVRFTPDLSGGIEGSARYLQENLRRSFGEIRGLGDASENRREQLYRTYLYWTPLPGWAVSTQIAFDKYNSEGTEFGLIPDKVATWLAPLSVRYFHHSGLFATLTGSFVHQDVRYDGAAGNFEGDSQFALVDASIGYRLPRRLGLISVQGLNLLDNGFKYQDDSYREFTPDPVASRFVPDRTVVGRVTLNF